MNSVSRNKKRSIKFLIRLIGPVLLIWALFKIENPKELTNQLANANPWLVGLAIAMNIPVVLSKILRWKHLLSNIEYTYPLKRASLAMLSSMYLGMVTPGRVGDILRAQYTKHDLKMPYAKGIASVFADRLFDVIALFFMVALGSLVLLIKSGFDLFFIFTINLGGLIVLLVLYLLYKTKKIKLTIPFLKNKLPKNDTNQSESFGGTLKKILTQKWLLPLLLSIGAFLLNYVQGSLMASAFGIHISFIEILAVLSISSLLSLLPISISGVGVRETFLTFAFPLLGLSAAQGVLFGLSIFAVIFIPIILVGFMTWQISPPPVVDPSA